MQEPSQLRRVAKRLPDSGVEGEATGRSSEPPYTSCNVFQASD